MSMSYPGACCRLSAEMDKRLLVVVAEGMWGDDSGGITGLVFGMGKQGKLRVFGVRMYVCISQVRLLRHFFE